MIPSYLVVCPGSIPKELGALGKLETLFVNDNLLKGEDIDELRYTCAVFIFKAMCAI